MSGCCIQKQHLKIWTFWFLVTLNPPDVIDAFCQTQTCFIFTNCQCSWHNRAPPSACKHALRFPKQEQRCGPFQLKKKHSAQHSHARVHTGTNQWLKSSRGVPLIIHIANIPSLTFFSPFSRSLLYIYSHTAVVGLELLWLALVCSPLCKYV